MTKKIKLTPAVFAASVLLAFLVLDLASATATLITAAKLGNEYLQTQLQALMVSLPVHISCLVFVLLSAIALLRGKKDTAAGVLFVISAVFFFLYNGSLGGILGAALFALLAVDCFLGGKLSDTPVSFLIPVLAVIATVLMVKRQFDFALPIVQDNFNTAYDIKAQLLAMGPLLVGIAIRAVLGFGLIFAGIAFTKVGTVREEGYVGMAGHVLLLLFAPGLWILVWIFRTTKFLNKTPDTAAQSPFGQLVLCMLVPFYAIFWFWKQAKRSDALAVSRGIPSDTATTALILAIFFPFASYIIVQNTVNKACLAPAPVAEPAEPAEPACFA